MRHRLRIGLDESAREKQAFGVLAPLAGFERGAHRERVAMQTGRQRFLFHVHASSALGRARRDVSSSSGPSWPTRASLILAMSSGLMSPVTYTPSKQDASKPSSFALS